MFIRNFKELINIRGAVLNNKTWYSTPPTALQPAVNPWPPINSASKLFHSLRSASSCDNGKAGNFLFYTLFCIIPRFLNWPIASEVRFQFFGGLYNWVGVFVNIQHILSCLFSCAVITILYKTTQMHSHIFLTALLTRYYSKGAENFSVFWCKILLIKWCE